MRRIAPSATDFGLVAVLSVAALVMLTAGCGGGGGGDSKSKESIGAGSPGEKVFASAGCAGCHTLADAGATGTVGPSLDASQPPASLVAARVREGKGVMPSFAGSLDDAEIAAVAAYVSAAAAG